MKPKKMLTILILFILNPHFASGLILESADGAVYLLKTDLSPTHFSYDTTHMHSEVDIRTYYPVKPVEFSRMSFTYTSLTNLTVRIDLVTGDQKEYLLPPGNQAAQIVLPAEMQLSSLTIKSDSGPWGISEIKTDADGEWTVFVNDESRIYRIPNSPVPNLQITMNNTGSEMEIVDLTLQGAGGSTVYRVRSVPGSTTFTFYRHEMGILPETVSVEGSEYVHIEQFREYAIPDEGAIPADIDTILYWPENLWRQNDYEIFLWNLEDNIYFIDFKNLEIQKRYLKRLAFHQEKKYSRGQLLSNEKLSQRPGWNAHDYSSEGLADFFNQAVAEQFQLNDEEWDLLRLILDLGIISRRNDGVYVPEGGALLSLTQESYTDLRYYFLTHESSHGLFFTDPDYQDAVWQLWYRQPNDAKEVWAQFLWHYGYDSQYEYLMVNEFQAYLLQQSTDGAQSFFNWRLNEIFDNSTAAGRAVLRFMDRNPQYFDTAARDMEAILKEHYGLPAGNFRLIQQISGP